jgi:peptidoglycan/LPS O-acetylase OafA/YrhL
MPDSMPQIIKRGDYHYPQLDGIRGLAILMVIIYHFIAISPLPQNSFEKVIFILAKSGWIGVDLFFVLSGFLITGILISNKQRNRYFINFYGRRILRIFPLYYLVLLIFFVAIPLCVDKLPHQLKLMQDNQVWFWTYLSNWYVAFSGDFNNTSGGYFWSLAVEEQFYIIWPILIYKLNIRSFRRGCIALFIFNFCLRNLLLFLGFSTPTVYAATITHMDGLLIGSWLSTVIREPGYSEQFRPVLNKSAFISFLLMVVILIYQQTFNFWDFLVSSLVYSLLAILFTATVSECMVINNGYLAVFFQNRYLRTMGKYSYAMYILHVPVSRGLKDIVYKSIFISNLPLPVRWGFFLISASAITYFSAYISWHCFEKHFLKLKVHFENKDRISAL